MAFRLKSFEIASDETFADASTITVTEDTDSLKIDAVTTALSEAGDLVDAILEFLNQPADGVVDTEKTLAGSGLRIEFDPTADTIKIGALAPMVRLKAEALVSALQTYVLA